MQRQEPMTKSTNKHSVYVALLRGVNVVGKNKLPMKDLAQMFAKAGCSEVKTYIQSGNVIFAAAPESCEFLVESVAKQIEKKFGHRPAITLRTPQELAKILRTNPFLEEGVDEKALAVVFLLGKPHPDAVATLDPNRSPGDRFAVIGREIYLHLPNGFAETKLTGAYFDSRLKVAGTARNWRTTQTLAKWAEDLTPR